MELSQAKANEAKKLKVSAEELIFADLLTLGYSENDAFVISHPTEATMSKQAQITARTSILSSARFQNLVEERRKYNATRLEFSGNVADIELIDSEETAKEILRIAKQLPQNSKERGEMFMKYADLLRKNDAATEEQTEAINFYFPVKCSMCPLLDAYNKHMEKLRDSGEPAREIRPVEMEGVIRKSKEYIDKIEGGD